MHPGTELPARDISTKPGIDYLENSSTKPMFNSIKNPDLRFFLQYVVLLTILMLSIASGILFKIIVREINPFFYVKF